MANETTTITQAFNALSLEEKEELRHHIAEAVCCLASCWDALREAENILVGFEIETDAIQAAAGETTEPGDAYKFIDLDYVLQILEGIEEEA